MEVAHEGNIHRLYALIREDTSILERNIDDKLLANTPLHVAASTGNHHFAAEVMRLKPSYARKLNPDGLSPMHIALQSGHDRMVEWFVSVDSNLVRDKGKEGTTPLHYVVAVENFNLLRAFLLACPECIEDLTTKRETALHIALKCHNLKFFEVLVRWLKKVEKEYILNWPDEDGNTVLHIATSKNQTEAVKLLLSKKVIRKIKVNAKNDMGLTALDIFQIPTELNNIEIGDMLCQAKALRGISVNHDPLEEMHDKVISKKMSLQEKVDKYFGVGEQKKSPDKDMSQAVLTVAVLIATATFQAVLSPPGGLWQDDYIPVSVRNATANTTTTTTEKALLYRARRTHIAGTPTMRPMRFCSFYFLNSVTFYASMRIIRLHTIALPHKLLVISQIFFSATYFCCLILISPIPEDSISISFLLFLNALNLFPIITSIRTSWWLRLLLFLNRRIRLPYISIFIFLIMFYILV